MVIGARPHLCGVFRKMFLMFVELSQMVYAVLGLNYFVLVLVSGDMN
jgi:hypothetical protein